MQEAQTPHNFGAKGFLSFENVTFVPFQTKCIDAALLSPTHRAWLDDYNAQCRGRLAPLLQEDPAALAWLLRETEPCGATPPMTAAEPAEQ